MAGSEFPPAPWHAAMRGEVLVTADGGDSAADVRTNRPVAIEEGWVISSLCGLRTAVRPGPVGPVVSVALGPKEGKENSGVMLAWNVLSINIDRLQHRMTRQKMST